MFQRYIPFIIRAGNQLCIYNYMVRRQWCLAMSTRRMPKVLLLGKMYMDLTWKLFVTCGK